MSDWEERAGRAAERYGDGMARLPDEGDERQRQLTRMGNAAWSAGLSLLMLDRRDDAAEWLLRAADRYRESWPLAPPGSWGRPIGAMKSRLLAGDSQGSRADARWALEAGAAESESPIGRYAAALAHLILGEDEEAGRLAGTLPRGDGFPAAVGETLVALAAGDARAYDASIRRLQEDFEGRDDFIEDTPVADSVLVLQVLAAARGLEIELRSALLPVPRYGSPAAS